MKTEPSYSSIQPIICGALEYRHHAQAWLSRSEAAYALACLWDRVAGSADWQGPAVLSIDAIGVNQLDSIWRPESPIERLPIDRLIGDQDHPLDTDALAVLMPMVEPPDSGTLHLTMDLVASVFILFSRWEDRCGDLPRDGRGNVVESARRLAVQQWMNRPVVDEWAMILGQWLEQHYPRWQPEFPEFQVMPSHDIDHIRYYQGLGHVLKLGGYTLRRTGQCQRTLGVLAKGLIAACRPASDPCLQSILDLAERDRQLGCAGVFFFMSAQPGRQDDGYDLSDPVLVPVIERLREQGHIIGWHPGYAAAEDPQVFAREARKIIEWQADAGDHARLHYLRWRASSVAWMVRAGVGYDHSWGLNDRMGFICGTCRPFPIWDSQTGEQRRIQAIPLLVQDGPILAGGAEGLAESMTVAAQIYRRSRSVHGIFSFLVHNDPLLVLGLYDRLVTGLYRLAAGDRAETRQASGSQGIG